MSTTGRSVVILDRAPAGLPPTPRMSVLSSRRTIMSPNSSRRNDSPSRGQGALWPCRSTPSYAPHPPLLVRRPRRFCCGLRLSATTASSPPPPVHGAWRPRAMSESDDPQMECFGYFRPCEIRSHSLLQIVSSQPHHGPYV